MIGRYLSCGTVLLALACGSPSEPVRTGGRKAPPRKTNDATGVPALGASLLTKVPAGTYGPYVGRRDAGALVVWAAAAGEQRKWFATPIGKNGAASAKPQELASAPAEVGLVAVKPAGKAEFVIASTRSDGETHHVEALLVHAQGARASAPIAIDRGADPIRWIDGIATPSGALVLWARQQGAAAELFAAPVSQAGMRGEPKRVAGGARSWQVVATAAGAAVAVIDRDSVRVVRIDASGTELGSTELVETRTAELDLDAAAIGDRVFVAWSDRRELDARVQLAGVDAAGKLVVPPRAAIQSADGDQALVRFVPPLGGGPAYLVWDVLAAANDGERRFRIASVTSEGKLGSARGEIRVAARDDTVPELCASPRGIAALTLSRACAKTASPEDCQKAERLPTFVELDRNFRTLVAEPMRLEALSGAAAELAWGLSCQLDGCHALAAVASDPAPIYSVELAARSSHWKTAGGPLAVDPPPRPRAFTTIAAVDPLSDVAAAQLDTTTLVAWVTYFDPTTPWKRLAKPAPDGRFDPLQAVLQVRALPQGKDATAPETISLRARSLGGVAIASGAPEHKEAMLVWTAVDAGQPQLFATIVGADGKKARQKMLTRTPGEKSDVAVAFAGDGWLIAWVDERHGDPEVYAAKFNRFFQRVGPERRLTNARGAATEIALLSAGDRVVMAFADARDSAEPGAADPFVLLLKSQDGAPVGPEQRLGTTRPHSFSPALARTESGVVVAWLESDSKIRIGKLDDTGKLASSAAITTAGPPTALALGCSSTCRVVAAIDRGERGELVSSDWTPGSSDGAAQRITALPGPASQAASLTLLGDDVVFADQIRDRGRVRRMTVEWR